MFPGIFAIYMDHKFVIVFSNMNIRVLNAILSFSTSPISKGICHRLGRKLGQYSFGYGEFVIQGKISDDLQLFPFFKRNFI